MTRRTALERALIKHVENTVHETLALHLTTTTEDLILKEIKQNPRIRRLMAKVIETGLERTLTAMGVHKTT